MATMSECPEHQHHCEPCISKTLKTSVSTFNINSISLSFLGFIFSCTKAGEIFQQAGAELGQAQVKLDDILEVVVDVVVIAVVQVEVKLLVQMGGWVVGVG